MTQRWFSALHLLSVASMLALAALADPSAHAQYTDLHDFDTPSLASPQFPGMLAQGRDGNLYGTAQLGGTSGRGGIFQVTPTGVYSLLYSFDNTIGVNPYSGLTLASDGSLLGANFNNGDKGFGTAFRFVPGGVPTTLHNFAVVEGSNPYAPPIQASDGNYYGVTSTGALGSGTVYKITSGGGFSVLYAFDGPHGSTPIAPLIQGTDGNLYGTTKVGGTFGFGTVFKITLGGTLTVLYNFDSIHGANIFAPLVQGSDGNFYGTARDGGTKNNGGVVFKLTPTKKLTVLYNFDHTGAIPDGNQPYAGLVQASDGKFYGTTSTGGTNSAGTLFRITSAGVYTKLYDFVPATGSLPTSTLRQHTNGKLYGEATTGGAANHGAFYSYDLHLKPFVIVKPAAGVPLQTVDILGGGLLGTTSVKFNGQFGSANIFSDTYITSDVASQATTGFVTVALAHSTLKSNQKFRVLPVIFSFNPGSGGIGSSVVITGNSFTGATKVAFGSKKAVFSVNSYSQITATVPAGAKTGKIQVTTPGGIATSATDFTVN
jgi:uncharacterized repeat protein (TIGR03803 family)